MGKSGFEEPCPSPGWNNCGKYVLSFFFNFWSLPPDVEQNAFRFLCVMVEPYVLTIAVAYGCVIAFAHASAVELGHVCIIAIAHACTIANAHANTIASD